MASGSFGKTGTTPCRDIVGLRGAAGISLGPAGFAGTEPGCGISLGPTGLSGGIGTGGGLVRIRGSCTGVEGGLLRLANLCLRTSDCSACGDWELMAFPWRLTGLGCTAGLALPGEEVLLAGEAKPSRLMTLDLFRWCRESEPTCDLGVLGLPLGVILRDEVGCTPVLALSSLIVFLMPS